MNIFLEPQTELASTRIPKSAKHAIDKFAKRRGLKNESQYIKLAIQNQITADEQTFNAQQHESN